MKKSFVITVPYSHLMHIKVKVNVYKTRADFIEGTGDKEALGLCQRYWKEDDEGNKILANRQVSTISLIEGHLGAGIVSHESAHAAVHIWCLFNKKKLDDTNDEPFAWVLGEITSKIYKGLYRLKIL